MNSEDILLLGLKSSVTAVSKLTGDIVWKTELSSGLGSGFVTLLCDGLQVFACCGGQLYGLDLNTGRILWTNGLEGYGYGLASLCLTDGQCAPPPAIIAQHQANQQSSSSSNSAT
jgi:outer membrane protein assembly factor BamB